MNSLKDRVLKQFRREIAASTPFVTLIITTRRSCCAASQSHSLVVWNVSDQQRAVEVERRAVEKGLNYGLILVPEGLVDAVFERSAGQPLFVEELVLLVVEDPVVARQDVAAGPPGDDG